MVGSPAASPDRRRPATVEPTASPQQQHGLSTSRSLAHEKSFSDADLPPADPAGPSTVTVVVDKVTLIPGAIAGGSVTFSDGVTGKWIIDQQYRPGFTEISQPGYRPSPADAQAVMKELGRAMQSRGF
jgi:hypothetical protein